MDKIKNCEGRKQEFLLGSGNIRLSHFFRKNKLLIDVFPDLWACGPWPPSLRSELWRNSSRLLEDIFRTVWWLPLIPIHKWVLTLFGFAWLFLFLIAHFYFPILNSKASILSWKKLHFFQESIFFWENINIANQHGLSCEAPDATVNFPESIKQNTISIHRRWRNGAQIQGGLRLKP